MNRLLRLCRSAPIHVKISCMGALVTLLFGAIVFIQFEKSMTRFFYANLKGKSLAAARSLSESVTRGVVIRDIVSLHEIVNKQKDALADIQYIFVMDSKNAVLARSESAGFDVSPERLSSLPRGVFLILKGDGHSVIDVQAPVLNGQAGAVHVGVSDRRLRLALRDVAISLLFVLILCMVIGQALAFALGFVTVKPIHALEDAARRMGEGDISARASIDSDDEIGRLAVVFNQMADSMKSLLTRLVSVHEEKKRTVAMELHDRLGPALSSLLLRVESMKRAGRGGSPPDPRAYEEMETQIKDAIADMRQMAFALRPAVLDDHGLDAALKQYVEFVQKHSGIAVEYEFAKMSDAERLPAAVETAFYRIAQEAITNVQRHSEAKSVSVVVVHRAGEATLVIEDDGKGFESAGAEEGRNGGLGVMGMRERAALLGGTLTLDSEPGKGVSIRVAVPLEATG